MLIYTSINTNQGAARDHKIDLGRRASVPIISCGDPSSVIIHDKSHVAVSQPLKQGRRALQRGVVEVVIIMRNGRPHSKVIQACTHLNVCVNPNDQFHVVRGLRPQNFELLEELPQIVKKSVVCEEGEHSTARLLQAQ